MKGVAIERPFGVITIVGLFFLLVSFATPSRVVAHRGILDKDTVSKTPKALDGWIERGRFEGNGGLTAFTAKYEFGISQKTNGMLGASSVKTPGIQEFELNKYGLPSYHHFTGSLNHELGGFLEGVKLGLTVVRKSAKKPGDTPDANRINRVDMWNLNLVLDYRF